MPIVVKKSRSNELKYPYAYDEFDNYLSIDSAINISSRKWYLYPNKQVELKLAALDAKIQQPHWRSLQNQKVVINGREYEYNHSHDTESYEHKLAKGKIIKESCVYYKGQKVLLFNAREEVRILDSRFRCDILATIEDGTPCAVEVIKSSDLSENKLSKINELQLLTFKIYIDDNGNQISSRDCIVGNRDIEQINARIQNGEGKIAEFRESIIDEIKRSEDFCSQRLQYFKIQLDKRRARYNILTQDDNVEFEREKEELRDSIERLEGAKRELLKGVKDRREYLREEIERVEKFNNGITEQVDKVESRVDDIRGQIEDCGSSKERIEREIKLFEDNIIRETNICRDIDEKFNKIAENCEVEWFRNKWMTHPYKDKVKELKYWTS